MKQRSGAEAEGGIGLLVPCDPKNEGGKEEVAEKKLWHQATVLALVEHACGNGLG